MTTTIANEAERLVESQRFWKGRHAKLIDGSTFMMPDTSKNQAVYPQNPAQKPGIGFPIARFVMVLSLATACVTWHRPNRPAWMNKELDDSMPKSTELREIRYVITKSGRKQDPFIIVTTMTDVESDDAVQYEDLAELFGFRWNAELDIRGIKTHLNHDAGL